MADERRKRPTVGVGVTVVRDGRVLVGKRRGGTGAGTWSTPGGFLEVFESFEDCARREAREEAGLHVNGLEVAAVTNDVMRAHGELLGMARVG